MAIRDIIDRHNEYVDSLLEQFERELNAIVASAMARVQAQLYDKLSIGDDGRIERSIWNARTLRGLDRLLMDALDRAGYGKLLNELVAQFPNQLIYFQETVQFLAEQTRSLQPVQFSARDLRVFTDQGLSARDGLVAAMETVAARARQRVLLSVGGLKFTDLVEALAEQVQRGIAEVAGLAETATATYYRTISDRGYQIIEADLPEMEIRYRYEGPIDKLNRPFCRHLLDAKKTYTRAEIDRMDNGQLPNCFITAGGYRCRHIWLLATK